MSLLRVARLGHPMLLRKTEVLDPEKLASADVQRLIDDMIETMVEAPGVGLAAPQVYHSLRLFVMDPGPSEDEDAGATLRVLVNPVLSFPDEEWMELWEGCLSVPGLRGRTERRAIVDVRYLDRTGESREERFEDFPAAVVQHEADHLDGIFFFQRMPDLSTLTFDEEFARWHAEPDSEEE